MAVERNKDGSVIIKNNNGVTVIGRIIEVSVDRREEKFKQWVEDCTKLVSACAHTLKETEQYFLQLCDALPLAPDNRNMKCFQYNVIMNHYANKLTHQPTEFSFDMTDEEIEKWQKEQNAIREEAINSSAEHFGLDMRGYYLPHTERNTVFYEQASLETQKLMKHCKHNPRQIEEQEDICFFFEETTEHYQSSGGGDSLMKQLIVYKGVSEDDIKKRSPRFLGYISTLRDMGILPGFEVKVY